MKAIALPQRVPPSAPTEAPWSPDHVPSGWPRLLSEKGAAAYYSVSIKTIKRLIDAGVIGVVRLPAARNETNNGGRRRANRRILIDRLELDALCERNREQVGR
jgi:hypothetical protein